MKKPKNTKNHIYKRKKTIYIFVDYILIFLGKSNKKFDCAFLNN